MTRPAPFILLSVLAMSPLTHVAAQDLLWMRQAGTTAGDYAYGVALDDAGNAYLAGLTYGSLGGANLGDSDAFLAKYDLSGNLLWTSQTGSTYGESVSAVAVDGAGNAYIVGETLGSFAGPNAGGRDVMLVKYDSSGTRLWKRQIGTTELDGGINLAVDRAGSVYVTGLSYGTIFGPLAGYADAFLAKYDTSGTLIWARQFGATGGSIASGVALDSAGNAYVTGTTTGSLGGPRIGSDDVFLFKFDASGVVVWTRQFGTTTADYGYGVAVDGAGDAYITGWTYGNLGGTNAGREDAFLVKYDASGVLLWARQFGTSLSEIGWGVAVDGAGNVHVTGYTFGNLFGSNAGAGDAFLAKCDASGTPLWTRQIGTSLGDGAQGVAVDGAGNAYITGSTSGSLDGPQAGDGDYFLAKFGLPTCPADFNHDGFVTGDDYDAYRVVFIAGDSAADFDGDGFVTGDDFDGYVAAFIAGC